METLRLGVWGIAVSNARERGPLSFLRVAAQPPICPRLKVRSRVGASDGFQRLGCYDLRMKAGFRDTYLAANLFLQAILPIAFVPGAVARQDSAPPLRKETANGRRADYATVAEAFQKELDRTPGSVELWMKWVDFDLERFRSLNLELRSLQSGMAVVLRMEAEGLRSEERRVG